MACATGALLALVPRFPPDLLWVYSIAPAMDHSKTLDRGPCPIVVAHSLKLLRYCAKLSAGCTLHVRLLLAYLAAASQPMGLE